MPESTVIIVVAGLDDAWERFQSRTDQDRLAGGWELVSYVRVPALWDGPGLARLRVFAALPEPDRLRLGGEHLASFYRQGAGRFYFHIQDRHQVRPASEPGCAPC